jgi:peptide/nickel transport system substrate-binding protein
MLHDLFTGVRVCALAALLIAAFAGPVGAEPKHGIAMHGEPALPPDFAHLPYADPNAPKGGRISFAMIGSFDSLNPFILKGTAPRGLNDLRWGFNVFESLMARNWDEPFGLYGLLAETVETPPDRSWIEFTLRPEARWADGEKVTPDDVVFSFELLRDKGLPREWYKKVESVEAVGERTVRFKFAGDADRELPLIVGLMSILPRHATDPDTFGESSLTPLMGSGPYATEDVSPGTSITLKRRPDYWGADVPVKRGTDNFNEIRVEYFRDSGSYFEAFKSGLFDYHEETDPGRWSSGYDFPAALDGRVAKDAFPLGVPAGMNGLVMNSRRPPFDDPAVRQAMLHFLDFEWLNRNLYFGLFDRTTSYFQGSVLASTGVPASEAEKAILAGGDIPDDILDGTWRPPVSDGSGRDREQLREGLRLLQEAGYKRQGNALVNTKTGAPLAFEILVSSRDTERLGLAFQRSLTPLGIQARVRLVDAAQYWQRLQSFDYDMIQFLYPSSLSPGNEQIGRWSSQSADIPGTFNFAGAKDAQVDAAIAAMLAASDAEAFTHAVRALDRALLAGTYVVPLFHSPDMWVGRWTQVTRPEKQSLRGAEPTTWWAK